MIRLSKSSISEQEVQAVSDILRKEYLGMGPEVQAFEQELKAFFNSDVEVVCVVNGTAALQIALQAAGIKAGHEVLVPSLTYVASFQAISATGATPVACDVRLQDGLIDLADAESRITPATKAIMPVHYASNAGDLDAIYAFAKKHQLRVIEDAAHAFGTRYQQQLIGNVGDVICFSFDGIKNITAGEGGAIVSRDKDVIQQVRDLRLLGVMKDSDKRYARERSWDFDVMEQGWRYHMSDIMAAIGRTQLRRFDSEFRPKRTSLASRYRKLLSGIDGIALFEQQSDNEVVPHILPVRILDAQRDAVREHCLANGIQVGMHYKPNHLLTKFKRNGVRLPNAEQLYEEMLTLPLQVDMQITDVDFVVEHVLQALKKAAA
jgi:dTDP-4-amino-4,6-dideoxygalactose transaminase